MFARRASSVKVVAKVNVVVDYEKLYKELQTSTDRDDDELHKLEMEVSNLKLELEKSKEATEFAESQRDTFSKVRAATANAAAAAFGSSFLRCAAATDAEFFAQVRFFFVLTLWWHASFRCNLLGSFNFFQSLSMIQRLESLDSGFKASLAAVGGDTSGDIVDAIEGVSEKWQEEIECLQNEYSREIENLKVKYEQNLKAYKAAANSATFDSEEVGFELEKARAGHLDTLNDVRALSEKLKENGKENAVRISELLDEVNTKSAIIEELEGKGQAQEKIYNAKISELVNRLDELEVANQKRTDETVSREAVLEMETLFTDTVEKLMERVNQLEGKAKERKDDQETRQVGRRIAQSRNENTDPKAMALLEQMENSMSRGSNVRVAPGRLRARNPRQAF